MSIIHMTQVFKSIFARGVAGAILLLVGSVGYAQRSGDPALQPPVVNINPLPKYGYDRLDYGMTIGIERTSNGRIWACWVAGGDSPEAFFVLASSDDRGETWSDPRVVIDPHDPALGKARRALIGNLWLDPLGRLWLFFDQSMDMFDGRGGIWYTRCDDPDSDTLVWSAPQRIWHGMSLNKPIVLSNGSWMLPASIWDRKRISTSHREAYVELDSLRMANVLVSSDEGKTWERTGGVRFPNAQFDEHNLIQRQDGSIWMTARTTDGIWQSNSTNQGKTWSAPTKLFDHITSRHFMRRLKSGKIILVKHGALEERTETRSKLMAFLSDDDGKTWKGGLMLDERRGISYPDGFQDADGMIYISYDRNRAIDGEVLMARFTEEDILAGAFNSSGSAPKLLISKPLGLDKLPPPSETIPN